MNIFKSENEVYYRHIILRALELMEAGHNYEAMSVLRGKMERCPHCGDFLTSDHGCKKEGTENGENTYRRNG